MRLYQTPESNGRQFPADTWSIDFLAKDQETNALVVIELKRGQSSDSTVGQVLRYIEWVRENIAEEDQKVEGLIICRSVDKALKFSVRGLHNVSVLTYMVNFNLKSVSLEHTG